MAIVSWPQDTGLPQLLPCAICNENRSPSELSVGLCDATGQQAFACEGHFRLGSQLIIGWAAFASRQRELLIGQEDNAVTEGSNGWMLR